MASIADIPPRLREVVERELDEGESIRWIGMPRARYFTSNSTPAFILSIPIGIFLSLFWGFVALSGEMFTVFSPLSFGVSMLMFLAFAMAPLTEYRHARKKVYVISDRRAIVFFCGLSTTVRSYLPQQLQRTRVRERPDGRGDVILAGHRSGDPYYTAHEFSEIDRPHDVHVAAQELAATWKSTDGPSAIAREPERPDTRDAITDISPRWQLPVRSELEPLERIRWIGRSRPRFFTEASRAWFVFGAFWTLCVAASRTGLDYFAFSKSLFYLAGAAMLSAPIWTYIRRRHDVYAITDHRAIAFEGLFSWTVRSYLPAKLRNVFRRQHRDGSGDLIIGHRTWRDSEGDRQFQELGFFAIERPREIETQLRELAATSTRSP